MEFITNSTNCAYYHCAQPLNIQLKQILQRMQAHVSDLHRLTFVLYDNDEHTIKPYADSSALALHHFHDESSLSKQFSLIDSMKSGQPKIWQDIKTDQSSAYLNTFLEDGFHSLAAVPTHQEDVLIGFVLLASEKANVFTSDSIDVLKPYIDMVKFAVTSEYQLVHSIVDLAEQTQALSPTYHRESQAHKERVACYCKMIALELADNFKLDNETVEHLALFSQFHDIGKVKLPVELLCKQSNLSASEIDLMKTHINLGIDIINEFIDLLGDPRHPSINLLRDIIAYHYEYIDGTGYPFGKQGDEIPLSARIVAVANIFDALTTHKPYQQAGSICYALLELEKMVAAGKLDKDCVYALRECQHNLKSVADQYPEYDPKDGFY